MTKLLLLGTALLAACWHEPPRARPPAPPPAPPVVAQPTLPANAECSTTGVMGIPDVEHAPERIDRDVPGETIELVTCKFPPEPYTPKLDEDGKPDENDAYWHSFSSWKVYLVRHGAHPFVWEPDPAIGVGQYHEGYADAQLVGVLPGDANRAPLAIIQHESGAMGMHSNELYVFRVDAPTPALVTSFSDDTLQLAMTPTGFTLVRCFYLDYDQSSHSTSCIDDFPGQVEETTYMWNGSTLATTATKPSTTPRPK